MNLLGGVGADNIIIGRFYVAVVQVVILFRSEKWIMTPLLEKSLNLFHYRVVWQMAGMVPKRQRDGTWVYPPIRVDLAKMGMDKIEVYIARRQNKAAQKNSTRTFMDLCLAAERKPGLHLSRRWWEQPALVTPGIILGHEAEEEG